MTTPPQDYARQARAFVRDYTQGLNVRDFRRLFEQDATHAYEVLTRDQETGAEPDEGFARALHRARIVFLGLSYKLTPARRLLFVASLLLVLLGLISGPKLDLGSETTRFILDFSALWFVAGAAGLTWLLALELVDRVRVRDELEVARQLQRDLLPKRSPDLPGYDFAHSYRTANEVGGDYYDFQPLPDGRLAILMGDASGHGIAAGLLMAIANATLKTAIDVDPEPLPVARLLNSALHRTGDRRAFMTLFYGVSSSPAAAASTSSPPATPSRWCAAPAATSGRSASAACRWACARRWTSSRSASAWRPATFWSSTPTACPRRSTGRPATPSASSASSSCWPRSAARPCSTTASSWSSTATSATSRWPTT